MNDAEDDPDMDEEEKVGLIDMLERLHGQALEQKEFMEGRIAEIKTELQTQNDFADSAEHHVDVTRDHMERLHQAYDEL